MSRFHAGPPPRESELYRKLKARMRAHETMAKVALRRKDQKAYRYHVAEANKIRTQLKGHGV